MPNYFDQFDEAGGTPAPAESNVGNFFDQFDEPTNARPDRTLLGTAKDIGITALKGAINLPQAFVGLGDIATGGRAGKYLEEAGYRPEDAKRLLDEGLSPAQQYANQQVDNAQGFGGTLEALKDNPSAVATTVVESLPQMLGGAGIARGLLTAAPRMAPLVAGAVGEGAVAAGSSAEQIRNKTGDGLLTPEQQLAATASGVGTAGLGVLGGRFAQKLGIGDMDTALAGGLADTRRNFFARLAGQGITEGIFEEMPQSAQEQMWQNFALGKPLDEGVSEAAATGLAAGSLTGAGFEAGRSALGGFENRTQPSAIEDQLLDDGTGQPAQGNDQGADQQPQALGYSPQRMITMPDGTTAWEGDLQQQRQQLGEAPPAARNHPGFSELHKTADQIEAELGSGLDIDSEIAALENDLNLIQYQPAPIRNMDGRGQTITIDATGKRVKTTLQDDPVQPFATNGSEIDYTPEGPPAANADTGLSLADQNGIDYQPNAEYQDPAKINQLSGSLENQMADYAKSQRLSVLPQGFDDERLARDEYRNILEGLGNQLTPGGDISYTRDGQDRITGRTSSVNPDWFKNLPPEEKLSVVDTQDAIKKALAGEKLGVRQTRLVKRLLDEAGGVRGNQAEHLKEQRKEVQRARKEALKSFWDEMPDTGNDPFGIHQERVAEMFNEDNYEPEASYDDRSIAEMASQAEAMGADWRDVDKALDSGDSAQTIQALSQLIYGLRNEHRPTRTATNSAAPGAAQAGDVQPGRGEAPVESMAGESADVAQPAETGRAGEVAPTVKESLPVDPSGNQSEDALDMVGSGQGVSNMENATLSPVGSDPGIAENVTEENNAEILPPPKWTKSILAARAHAKRLGIPDVSAYKTVADIAPAIAATEASKNNSPELQAENNRPAGQEAPENAVGDLPVKPREETSIDISPQANNDADSSDNLVRGEKSASKEQRNEPDADALNKEGNSEKNIPPESPRPKSKKSLGQQRSEKILGATTGDKVIPSADTGYLTGGTTYEIQRISKSGEVDFKNTKTGGGTSLSLGEMNNAERAGVVFEVVRGEKPKSGHRKTESAEAPKDYGGSLFDDPQYSLADSVGEQQVGEIIARIQSSFGAKLKITAVASAVELPPEVQAHMEKNGIAGNKVKGVFHGGSIFVNREALQTAQDVEAVILHELAHVGLAKMFGPDIQAVMGKLYFAIGGDKALRELARKYAMPLEKYQAAYASAKPAERLGFMTEELLAHIAENNKPSVKRFLKELIGAIRSWLRSKGFLSSAEMSESELFALLKEVRQFAAVDDGGIRFSLSDGPRPSGGFSLSGVKKVVTDAFKSEQRLAADRARETLPGEIRDSLDRLGDARNIRTRVRDGMRRWLTPSGLLPKDVHKLKLERDGQLNGDEFHASIRLQGFYDAVKEGYQKEYEYLVPATKARLNQAMRGEDVRIPDQVKTAIAHMRDQIKRLSAVHMEQLLDDAAALEQQGDEAGAAAKLRLADTIAGNFETYLHRSYRAFDDPDWPNKVRKNHPEVYAAAVNYLANGYADGGQVTREHLDLAKKKVALMLEEGTAFDSMGAFISESKLGAKDLSIIKRRKTIAPEILALLGEYEDAPINYTKSVAKMSRLVYNHAFLKKLREHGFEAGLFSDSANTNLGHNKKIAGDASETYAPLNGLYTTHEFHQALVDAMGKETEMWWYRQLVSINGMVKFGKTVLSPTTALRNLYSAMFFSLTNGHFDFSKGKNFSWSTYFAGKPDALAYMEKLRRLGVVYDNPYAGEMMALLKDSRLDETVFNWKPFKWTKTGIDYAQKFYGFGDDLWKIIGFENEKAMLIKHKGMSEAAAEVEAAERIRNTYPTYSLIPKAVNALRRFPLVGTFVSFPAEIIRTSYHIVRYFGNDIRELGIKSPMVQRKAVGLLIASASMYALQAITKALVGVDDDEEKALRLMSPPWQKNSNLAYLGRDDKGALQTMDMSFLDPYGYWKRPLNALLQDQPLWDAIKSGAKDVLSPFFGQDITFGAIMDVAVNQKDTGGRVFNPQDTVVNQTLDISGHIAKAIQPGIVSNITRMYMAATGKVTASGKKFDVGDEMAALAGFRWGTFDPKTALYYQTFSFTDAKADASRVLTDALKDPNKVDEDELRDAFDTAMKARNKAYERMGTMVSAAQKSGLTKFEVLKILKDSGLSRDDSAALANGKIPDWKPTKSKAGYNRAKILFSEEVARELKAREQLVNKWRRE